MSRRCTEHGNGSGLMKIGIRSSGLRTLSTGTWSEPSRIECSSPQAIVRRLAARSSTDPEISAYLYSQGPSATRPCRSCSRTRQGCALAEEAPRLLSRKIDWDDYSHKYSDDAANETHATAVEDLSYSKPYRDDVDYDADHPIPSCPRIESGAYCKPEDPEYDDYDCEREGSRSVSGKNRSASIEGEQAPRSGDNRYNRNTYRSLGLRPRGLHPV